jgi:hypothetical protein
MCFERAVICPDIGFYPRDAQRVNYVSCYAGDMSVLFSWTTSSHTLETGGIRCVKRFP